ncbi:hypothetical protein CSH63_17850 [Micromonospora tulbaghiae]|uniref:Uncharacterized protein n=1 Tax=Micromonospora tulbaghiae TaxID=479978 RepID=A0A386WLK4_9ACTN|nr:hypothetical protein [Micromonospora tulbaghiae]AYF29295.1 hypothetical protein CSH63_17850 [Micromonospora tulbaghiae]
MNRSQVAAILALAAARDRRTVGEVDVRAWHEDIGDLDFDDARQAISAHFRQSTEYLMPVHVRRLATEIRRERHRVERETEQQRALQAYRADAGPLTDRSAEIRAFVGHVREVIPDGSREALRPRAVEWERQQRAQAEPEPNPAYDPSMQPVREWCSKPNAPTGQWWENDAARERHAKELLAEAGRLRPRAEQAPAVGAQEAS